MPPLTIFLTKSISKQAIAFFHQIISAFVASFVSVVIYLPLKCDKNNKAAAVMQENGAKPIHHNVSVEVLLNKRFKTRDESDTSTPLGVLMI